MNQWFRHQNQNAVRPPGLDPALHDQARLNRFTQTNLIRQQDARGQTMRRFPRYVELMWDQFDPAAHKTTDGRATAAMLVLESSDAQVECLARIGPGPVQPLFRGTDANLGV